MKNREMSRWVAGFMMMVGLIMVPGPALGSCVQTAFVGTVLVPDDGVGVKVAAGIAAGVSGIVAGVMVGGGTFASIGMTGLLLAAWETYAGGAASAVVLHPGIVWGIPVVAAVATAGLMMWLTYPKWKGLFKSVDLPFLSAGVRAGVAQRIMSIGE